MTGVQNVKLNVFLSKVIGGPLSSILSATPIRPLTLKFREAAEETKYQQVMHIVRRHEHRRTCIVYMSFGVALAIFDYIFIPEVRYQILTIGIHLLIIPMCAFPYLLFRYASAQWNTSITFVSLCLSIVFLNIIPELVLMRDCQFCIYYPAKVMFQTGLIFIFCAQSFDVTPTFLLGASLTVAREIVYYVNRKGNYNNMHNYILLFLEICACSFSCYQVTLIRRATFHLQYIDPNSSSQPVEDLATLLHNPPSSAVEEKSQKSRMARLTSFFKGKKMQQQNLLLSFDKVKSLIVKSMVFLTLNAVALCIPDSDGHIPLYLQSNIYWFMGCVCGVALASGMFSTLYTITIPGRDSNNTTESSGHATLPFLTRAVPGIVALALLLQFLFICVLAIIESNYSKVFGLVFQTHLYDILSHTFLVYAAMTNMLGMSLGYTLVMVLLGLVMIGVTEVLVAPAVNVAMGWSVLFVVITCVVILVSKHQGCVLQAWFSVSSSSTSPTQPQPN
jgi:hypothetical protein